MIWHNCIVISYQTILLVFFKTTLVFWQRFKNSQVLYYRYLTKLPQEFSAHWNVYSNDHHQYPVVCWMQKSPRACHLEDLIFFSNILNLFNFIAKFYFSVFNTNSKVFTLWLRENCNHLSPGIYSMLLIV